MKGTIKIGNTRTYAIRQYENIKPSIEFEVEFDTKNDDELDKLMTYLKNKCEDYLEGCSPIKGDELPFR